MVLHLDGVFSKEFVEDFIVRVIDLKINTSLMDRNLSKLNAYLKKLDTDVTSIIEQIKYDVNKYNNTWVISINNNIFDTKSKEKIISLLKLIEYGNLEVKGLHIIDEAFRYVKIHLKELYKYYQMKGGK